VPFTLKNFKEDLGGHRPKRFDEDPLE